MREQLSVKENSVSLVSRFEFSHSERDILRKAGRHARWVRRRAVEPRPEAAPVVKSCVKDQVGDFTFDSDPGSIDTLQTLAKIVDLLRDRNLEGGRLAVFRPSHIGHEDRILAEAMSAGFKQKAELLKSWLPDASTQPAGVMIET